MKLLFTACLVLVSLICFGQDSTSPQKNWFNLDQELDKVNGVGTDRVYSELLAGKKSNTVIVGVIDSGVDIEHEDLKSVIWTNEKEIAGNGIDDDKNGYIDDVHGWNFIGGKDGKNISDERLEVTRLYKFYNDKYIDKEEKDVENKKEYQLYQKIKDDFTAQTKKCNAQLSQVNYVYKLVQDLNNEIKEKLNVSEVTIAALKQYKTEDVLKKQVIAFLESALSEDGLTVEAILTETNEGKIQLGSRLKYNLNPDFNPRPEIVGDDINNAYQKNYGNNDVIGSDASHGTHVSGIIAAVRDNNIGIQGIADNVKIMPIRAVPNGDERDKDIANAVIYAVDNGAQIINMSFGKPYYTNKDALDKAFKYAESKNVLIVHAAGNEHANIDRAPNFPTKKYEASKKVCKTWIEVGALSWKKGENLPAVFSNYGEDFVDVFAPGVDIYSTVPGGNYKKESGTSMACPATAGVAAVLKSYFPDLSAKQIKKIIEKSANVTAKNIEVNCPSEQGSEVSKIKFSKLSKTGGYINLYAAVKMAIKMTKFKI